MIKLTSSIFMSKANSSHDEQPESNNDEICSTHFLEIDSNCEESLKQHSITHVLSLVHVKPSSVKPSANITHSVISYGSMVSETTESVSDFFEGCLNFLIAAFKCKKEDKPFGILIRTDYEADFSPCVVGLAFYLTEEKKLSVDKSIEFIHERLRPENLEESVHDWLSPIFVEQLKFYITEKKESNSEYYCQICRLKLFSQNDLLEHSPSEKRGLKDFEYKKLRKDAKRGVSKTSKSCTSLYVTDKMQWMGPLKGDEGRITCQCGHRVGAYKWSGSQCSCGIWVSPSIQIQLSRVDKK